MAERLSWLYSTCFEMDHLPTTQIDNYELTTGVQKSQLLAHVKHVLTVCTSIELTFRDGSKRTIPPDNAWLLRGYIDNPCRLDVTVGGRKRMLFDSREG